MKRFLRNRETRLAIWVGLFVAIAATFVWAISFIYSEGGGTFSLGWRKGWRDLIFYGIFSLPVFFICGLIAMGLAMVIGGGIIFLMSVLGLGTLLIYSVINSTYTAQFSQITGCSGIPELHFEQFKVGKTFSDGTAYLWVIQCDPDEASMLATKLNLKPILPPTSLDMMSSMNTDQLNIKDWCDRFEMKSDGIEFYYGHEGMIAGYSRQEQRFRIYWWPEVRRDKNG